MSIPVFMNKWIWFVVMTIFSLLPITHSSCNVCGSERIIVNNNNIKNKMIEQFRNNQGHKISCFDTSKVTNMYSLFYIYKNAEFSTFNEDISCWDTSSVTNMAVSRLLSLYLSHEYTYDYPIKMFMIV